MIRTSTALTSAIFCFALMTHTMSAQAVKVNWRTRAPFGDYKTYAWIFTQNQENSFYRQFVREYVDQELQKKGLMKISSPDRADLKVAYQFTTQELMDATTTSDGFGWGGWGGGMGPDISTTEERPRTIGILTVDLADAKKNELVWRGQATEHSLAKNQKGDEKQVKNQ